MARSRATAEATATDEVQAPAPEETPEATPATEEASAPPPATEEEAPPPPAKPVYRVHVPGVRVRTVDAEGRPGYADHLDVEATNEGEAWIKFKEHNGIISTSREAQITKVS